MSWRIRHQGSPQAVAVPSLAQVVEGLQDDKFDVADEVMGPADKSWTTIDAHPQLAELANELDDARTKVVEGEDPEEQRIDMNPLIDVCLVLLVFFILATTLTVLEKVLDIPQSRADRSLGYVTRTREEVLQTSIYLKAFKKDGRATITINEQVVAPENLQTHLDQLRRELRRNELVIDAQGVEWETVVTVIDAASGAGIRRVQFVTNPRSPV